MIGTVLTVAMTTWLLFAERSESRGRFVAKPLASLGFILVPVLEGFETDPRGVWTLAGLVLGMAGDVFLLSPSTKPFLAGLGSFLLGHVAYVMAFTRDGVDSIPAFIATAVMLVVSSVALRWLKPHLTGAFSIAVPVYVIVIALMVITASGSGQPLAVFGAAAFAASDLFVARERFVESSIWNRLLGLPLYYSGQLMIAWSVVSELG